jgi:hypothetical protein
MRRREERLAILLEGEPVSENTSKFSWIRKLGSPGFASRICVQELAVPSRVDSFEGAFLPQTDVFDGLGPFSEHFEAGAGSQAFKSHAFSEENPFVVTSAEAPSLDSTDEKVKGTEEYNGDWTVHSADMIPMPDVQRLAMPVPQQTMPRQCRLIATPGLRSSAVTLGPVAVRALESFRDRPADVRDGNRLLLSPLPVYSFPKISKFVYRRKSVDLQILKDTERMSFLQEADAIKHIPAERAELLGVFRSVPIELISRLRFLSSRNEVVYSLVATSDRTSTRVHDIAAVRDTSSHEVHLIPHRIRWRAVSLVLGKNGVK